MNQLPDVIPADQFVEDSVQPKQESKEPDTSSTPDTVSADQFVSDEDKYGTAGQQLKTAAEHAASSATFGLSTKAETALGIAKPEDIRARTEENPGSAIVGDIAGLVVPGAPEAKALSKVGQLAGSAIKGTGLLARAGSAAVKGAVENAMFQAGDEVSKNFAQDPGQTSQTVIANIGLSGLLGGGLGAGFGAVSPLWSASKASKFVDEFKSRFNEHLTNPDLGTQASDELSKYHSDTTKGSNDLYYGSYDQNGIRQPGVKEQAIAQLVPEMNPEIQKGIQDVSDKLSSKLEEMKTDSDTYQPKFTKALEKDLSEWQQVVNNPEAKSSDVFFATEDLKRNLQNRSKIGIPIDNSNPAFDSIKSYKELASYLRKGLEDTDVWGDAGKFQRDTNQAFAKFSPALKDFNQSFATKINGQPTVDPDKVSSYLNTAARDKGVIRSQKLQNYLDAGDKYRDAINNAHEQIGLDKPFESQGVNSAAMALGKLTPGARAADSVVKNMINKSASEAAGAIGGVLAGWPGYMVGKHVAGPVLDSILPNLIKPVLGSAADGTAFKHAIDYIGEFAKGEASINRGISNLFKAGKEAIPTSMSVSDKDKQKLDKTLQSLNTNPEPMTEVGGKVAGYLPDHGQQLSQTAMNAVNYLNSQRPQVPKAAPLDPDQKPSPLAMDAWNRTLTVAQQPLSILNHIKNGTLQPTDVKTLQALYPDLYNKLSGKILSEVANAQSKGIPIPYKTKMGMSLFAIQPLDSTMTQQGIMATQPVPQQQPPQTPNRPKKTAEQSAKAMAQVSQSNMTPEQKRSADHSGVKS